jgi:hypothetical protein
VSLSTVKRLTARADFPTAVRLGGSVRWVAAEVDAWTEAQRGGRPSGYVTGYGTTSRRRASARRSTAWGSVDT